MDKRILSDEELLGIIKKNAGGGGGTSDYSQLTNKPQIGGNTLIGNKSLADLGIASAQDVKVKDVKVDNASCVDENGNAVVVIKKPLAGKVYKFSTPSMEYTRVQTFRDDELLSTVDYWYRDVYRNPVTVDDVFTLTYPNSTNWYVTLLVDVIDHSAGDVFYWAFGATPSIAELDCIASILDVELSAAYAELDNAIKYNEDAIDTIKDGQSIDSFADVETALSGKQATLTFDDAPTDGSNNPVKSNGIYDALATKQDATDNSLDTTAKTIVGAINEHEGDVTSLNSNFTSLGLSVVNGKLCQTYSA